MLDIVLFEPEIPGNTGNIIRLCANTGVRLHLIKPLGFSIEDSRLKRAGLDYHEWTNMRVHESWPALKLACAGQRFLACSTKATQSAFAMPLLANDVLVFGPETRGLPASILAEFAPEACLRLPMRAGSRSLNLANSVAVIVYEAWRQAGFPEGN